MSQNEEGAGQNEERRADRPQMPADYGVPATGEGLLPWEHARQRLEAALHYWIATVRPDGRPHATPVWGVWLDDLLYFDGSPETRRGRNIAANPAVVAHLEDGQDVVIVEGNAQEVRQAPYVLRERLAAAYSAKYAERGYAPAPETWEQGGLYALRPSKVLAWSDFPRNVTRWRFA